MIVDSSVWIAHLRGTNSPAARRLASALNRKEPIALPDIVLMWAGLTPRSGNDCLIACCAIEAGEPLLHEDRDFRSIAELEPALVLVS